MSALRWLLVAAIATGCTDPPPLVRTVPEPAGSNCPNGGTKILSGADDNGDEMLEESEVERTTYDCNTALDADS